MGVNGRGRRKHKTPDTCPLRSLVYVPGGLHIVGFALFRVELARFDTRQRCQMSNVSYANKQVRDHVRLRKVDLSVGTWEAWRLSPAVNTDHMPACAGQMATQAQPDIAGRTRNKNRWSVGHSEY